MLEHRLAHSVAHATFAMDNRLDLAHVEKLLLLFDIFEVINGGRDRTNNESLHDVLRNLTPAHIEALRCRHHLEPASENAWVKGYTGGADDHAGIFAARTYTMARSAAPEGFVQDVRARLSPIGQLCCPNSSNLERGPLSSWHSIPPDPSCRRFNTALTKR